MPQIFNRHANMFARIGLRSLVVVPLVIIATLLTLRWTGYVTGEDRIVSQPVPFSHRHHTAEIGIDCRYCHTGVEHAASAGIPPTKTCMTCHSQLWDAADMLKPVRDSWTTGERLRWNAVHNLPDYVYFAHNVHVANGVPCTACHGAVGDMRLIGQQAPLTMGWCLDCHRDPGPNLRPQDEIYAAFPTAGPEDEAEIHALLTGYDIQPDNLTDCTTCHR